MISVTSTTGTESTFITVNGITVEHKEKYTIYVIEPDDNGDGGISRPPMSRDNSRAGVEVLESPKGSWWWSRFGESGGWGLGSGRWLSRAADGVPKTQACVVVLGVVLVKLLYSSFSVYVSASPIPPT